MSKKPQSSRLQAPGYGFPEGKKGLLPWSWAEQRLKRSHNYWITTVKPDGSPHVMVVWGLWQNGQFLFSTGSQSQKTKNLEHNPKCVVCTENAQEAIIVEGVAEIADVKTRRKFLTPLRTEVQVRYVVDEARFARELSSPYGKSIFRASRRAGNFNNNAMR